MSEFTDPVIGRCKFKDGFYITNDLYGGYSYDCEHGSGSTSYTEPSKVLKLAEAAGKEVHLAGNVWELVGEKGWGQKVSIEKAKSLLNELKKKEWKPGPWTGGPRK